LAHYSLCIRFPPFSILFPLFLLAIPFLTSLFRSGDLTCRFRDLSPGSAEPPRPLFLPKRVLFFFSRLFLDDKADLTGPFSIFPLPVPDQHLVKSWAATKRCFDFPISPEDASLSSPTPFCRDRPTFPTSKLSFFSSPKSFHGESA